MQFKNLESGAIIEVDKKDVERIEKLKGYPDKFEVVEVKVETGDIIEVNKEVKEIKNETKEKNNK